MGRPRRFDPKGGWHHVWGRGIAKKPIFENRAAIRHFQAALACAVRRGEIEVHSCVFLTTHFHLLIRSPKGELSRALARVLSDFTRYFNRGRDRDGTVWRGRFSSKPVLSYRYRRALVRYIDQNPVQARMSESPWTYEHGSAQRFVFRTPKWLNRTWIDEEIRMRTGKYPSEGGRYELAFPLAHDAGVRLVEAREVSPAHGPDPLDDLLAAAPDAVRRWLEQRSQLADATKPGHPIVDPATVLSHIAEEEHKRPHWSVNPHRRPVPAFRIVRVALLRDLSGQTFTSIARHTGISSTYAKSVYRDHGLLVVADPEYSRLVLDLTLRLLAAGRGDS